jgi:hypothetical protein
VRFRKQLSTRPVVSGAEQASANALLGSRSREHAVFVVNAPHLMAFLEDLDIDQDALRGMR